MQVRDAVILAAGLGKRLRKISGKPKFAIEILGKPLIRYPVESLCSIGVRRFVIIFADIFLDVGRRLVGDMERDLGVEIEIVSNPNPEKGNGTSFLLTQDANRARLFFVSMCDHIYVPSIPLRLLRGYEGEDLIVGGDSDPRYIDLAEATKVLADDGRIVAIGKNLRRFTHVDIGLFLAKRTIYECAERDEDLPFSELILRARDRDLEVRVVDIRGLPWTEVDTPEDLREIEQGSRRRVVEEFHSAITR